jgi:integrase
MGILDGLKQNAKSEHVFTTQEGLSYISRKSWDGAWKKAVIKAGIKYRSFHVLRHTFVSNLIVEEKEDYATVMAISGHKDMRMLQRYSHTRGEAKKSAVNKLERRFKSEAIDTYLDTSAEKCEYTHSNVIGLTNLK